MASHHHNHHYHHHQLQQQQQNNYPTCNCYCCCTSPPPSSHHPSPPSQSHPFTADPLLIQSIVTQILQSSPNHLYPQFLQPQKQKHRQDQHYHLKQQQEKQTRSLLTSLHRRIDALESSLHHLSSSPSFSPPLRLSLRDLAARTIQTHFRAFLVRRSRTLGYLKYLAFIKSSFNALKSTLSSNAHLDHVSLSQKAMDLLLKLDSVQGGDPMIRDGKRSISRELVRFLEFVDGISVKRQQISSRAMKNVRLSTENNKEPRVFINTDFRDLGGNHRVFLNKLNHQAQEIQGSHRVIEDDDDDEEQGELEGLHPINDQEENPRNLKYQKSELFQPQDGILVKRPDVSFRSKKRVSFADNGNISRVFISTQDSNEDVVSIGDIGVSVDDQRELVENLCKEVEEIGGFSSRVSEDDDEDEEEEEEEAEFENKGPPTQFSDGERNPREYVRTEVNHPGLSRHFHSQNGKFVFSAPVPVQMEPRIDDDLMRRKNNQRVMR